MTCVRVVVADDHALFREGLVALLGTADEIEVVGVASDGEGAIEICGRVDVDVVLMDLQMAKVDGITATARLQEAGCARPRVLVLTTFEDDRSIRRALEAGAVGYLLKDVSRGRLIEAIVAASRGEAPFSDRVGARLIRWLDPTSANTLGLSKRENEVLEAVCEGMTNRQIAHHLGVSEGTVKNHLTRVFEKLEVEDRTQAAIRAFELGIVQR